MHLIPESHDNSAFGRLDFPGLIPVNVRITDLLSGHNDLTVSVAIDGGVSNLTLGADRPAGTVTVNGILAEFLFRFYNAASVIPVNNGIADPGLCTDDPPLIIPNDNLIAQSCFCRNQFPGSITHMHGRSSGQRQASANYAANQKQTHKNLHKNKPMQKLQPKLQFVKSKRILQKNNCQKTPIENTCCICNFPFYKVYCKRVRACYLRLSLFI
jgi:hypothetical protein